MRALVVLGLNYGSGVVRIQTIANHQNVPKRFLEQILNDLKAAGIVASILYVRRRQRAYPEIALIPERTS